MSKRINEEMPVFRAKTKQDADLLDFKLDILIYEALGQASMCWDSPESAGQFDPETAIIIGRDLREKIKDLIRKL